MRNCFLFLLLLSCCIAAARPLPDHRITVCGRVTAGQNTSRVISLTYAQFSVSPTRLTSILDTSGSFQFEFQLVHPQNVLLKFEQGTAELYVKPRDSLFVTISPSEFKTEKYPVFQVSGTGAETTKNILTFRRNYHAPPFAPASAGKTVTAYLKEISKQIDLEDSLLKGYEKTHNTTEDFRSWATKRHPLPECELPR